MSSDSTISISEKSPPNYCCFKFPFPKMLSLCSLSAGCNPEGELRPPRPIPRGTRAPSPSQTQFFRLKV